MQDHPERPEVHVPSKYSLFPRRPNASPQRFAFPMRHSSTRQLHAYWQRQRNGMPAPLRSAIQPAHIASLLGDIFLLDASRASACPFRLAGTRLCANLGRELTGADFLRLWQDADRETIEGLVNGVIREAATAVIDIAGRTERGHGLAAEMVLLPVSQDGRRLDRILGLLAPIEQPYWLGLHAISTLRIVGTRWLPSQSQTAASAPLPAKVAPPADTAPPQGRAQPDGRRHQHLVVLDGGRG